MVTLPPVTLSIEPLTSGMPPFREDLMLLKDTLPASSDMFSPKTTVPDFTVISGLSL